MSKKITITKAATAGFFILLTAVFVVNVIHRNDHFQECDSTQVYDTLTNFPVQSISFTAQLNSSSSFISTARAQSILAMPLVSKLISAYQARYHVADQAEFNARLVRALTRLNPVTAFRAAYVSVLSQLPLPYFIKSFFALPTGTTYAPAAGLLYGLISSATTPYQAFMSRATFLTLLLFALSVALVFFACRKLGASAIVAALTATLMMFSISIYSYGYHLGSTIFNIFSAALWILLLITYANDPKFLKKMSIATAILVFFNYLIIIYWIAFAAVQLLPVLQPGGRIRKIWNFIKGQWLTITASIIVLIFFYPPGQSYRGIFSLQTIPSYAYDIVLNFFGFYNHSSGLNILQFVLAALLLALAGWQLFTRCGLTGTPQREAFKKFSLALLVVYFVSVVFHVLAFFPSRHILVFAPMIFIVISVALQAAISRLHIPNISVMFLWVALIILGFISLVIRTGDTQDRLTVGPWANSVSKVYVNECTAGIVGKDWETTTPVEEIKPVSFAPQPGQNYLYISQYGPFDKDLQMINAARADQNSTGTDLNVKILSSDEELSGTCFIGYYPNIPGASCGGFGETNSVYRDVFTVEK